MARYSPAWLALPLLLLTGCTGPALTPVDPPADRPGATAPLRPGAWNGLVRRAEPGSGLIEPGCSWRPGTEVTYEARREIITPPGGENLRRDSRLHLRFLERTAEGYVIERVETEVATIRQPGALPPVPAGEAVRAVQAVLLTQSVRISTDGELVTLGVMDEAATRDRVLREARRPVQITPERWSRAIEEVRVVMAPPGFTQLASRDLTALFGATCSSLAVGEPMAVHAEREEPSFGITTGSRFEITLLRVADGKATVRIDQIYDPASVEAFLAHSARASAPGQEPRFPNGIARMWTSATYVIDLADGLPDRVAVERIMTFGPQRQTDRETWTRLR